MRPTMMRLVLLCAVLLVPAACATPPDAVGDAAQSDAQAPSSPSRDSYLQPPGQQDGQSDTVSASLPPPPPGAHVLAAGTGFFIAADGTLLTAAHVVAGCRRVDVGSDRIAPGPARVVFIDRTDDMALVHLPVAGPHPILPLAKLPPGAADALQAFGYPRDGALLHASDAQPVLLNAFLRKGRRADPRDLLWLRSSRIVQGWSGGPVIDQRSGMVIGFVEGIVADAGETTKILDRAESGVALAVGIAPIQASLQRAGREPEADSEPGSGSAPAAPLLATLIAAPGVPAAPADPRQAILRVFCWR